MTSSHQIPPGEFTEIGLEPTQFKRSCPKSWRGPCPKCGGSRRYLVFTDHPFPMWNGRCDQCGYSAKYWKGRRRTISEAERLQAQEENERQQAIRDVERRRKLAEFTTEELWRELHERMTEENYTWWASQGVPHDWADFWQLGYTANKAFEHDGVYYERPAYSIPKFDLHWTPKNMDFRLIDPPDGVGKYRPAKGLSSAAFLSRPDWDELGDEVVVVEGSKKAMVISILAAVDKNNQAGQVVGLPGCNSWAEMPERLKSCGRVWVVLDPDAVVWAYRLAAEIGENARVVELPCKPDDAFLMYGMNRTIWQRYLHYGVKV